MMSNYNEAKRNPSACYKFPEDVLTDPDLSREEKEGVLLSWKDEAVHLQESTGEGMGGGERSQIDGVARALKRLEKMK